jgi:hypothetical protein
MTIFEGWLDFRRAVAAWWLRRAEPASAEVAIVAAPE